MEQPSGRRAGTSCSLPSWLWRRPWNEGDAVWEHCFAFQWDAPVRVEDHDILDNGEHAMALLDIVVGSGEDQRSWKTAEVVHLRDGLIAERWAFTERQAELDEIARQAAD